MSKPFLENMSKEERQAFSYLENLIIKSKMECITAIPKTQNYDDSKILDKINAIESKNNNLRDHINKELHTISAVVAMSFKSWIVFRDLMNLLTINNKYIDRMVGLQSKMVFGEKISIKDAEELQELLNEYKIIEKRCESVKKDIENYEDIMKGKQFDILEGFNKKEG